MPDFLYDKEPLAIPFLLNALAGAWVRGLALAILANGFATLRIG